METCISAANHAVLNAQNHRSGLGHRDLEFRSKSRVVQATTTDEGWDP